MPADAAIVGGGPSGLAAAIALRLRGFSVSVYDARRPPIDKPCGEGFLPGAASYLRELGIELARDRRQARLDDDGERNFVLSHR